MEVVYVIICCQNKGLCPIQRFDGTACEQGFEIEIPPMTMTDTRTIIRHISVSEFFTLLLFMDIKLPFL